MDNTYGGRHVSPSEAGTQAAQEIARREAAEQARRSREMAEAAERNRQLQAQNEQSQREAAQRRQEAQRREEQRRAQQQREQAARKAASTKWNAQPEAIHGKSTSDRSSGSALQKLITLVAVLAAGGWAWTLAEGDARLWTVGIAAVIAGALAWSLYKVIVALVVLAILGFVAIAVIARLGAGSELASVGAGPVGSGAMLGVTSPVGLLASSV